MQKIYLFLKNPINLFIIRFPDHVNIAQILLCLISLGDTEVAVELLRGDHSAVAFVDQVLAGVGGEGVWVVFEYSLFNLKGKNKRNKEINTETIEFNH
jgi:hypothetical protein